jgi:hypothetical protein
MMMIGRNVTTLYASAKAPVNHPLVQPRNGNKHLMSARTGIATARQLLVLCVHAGVVTIEAVGRVVAVTSVSFVVTIILAAIQKQSLNCVAVRTAGMCVRLDRVAVAVP